MARENVILGFLTGMIANIAITESINANFTHDLATSFTNMTKVQLSLLALGFVTFFSDPNKIISFAAPFVFTTSAITLLRVLTDCPSFFQDECPQTPYIPSLPPSWHF